jgi:hypothetical protein
MIKVEFNDSDEGKHKCTAIQYGCWVVYRCPLCPGFERRFNLTTGEMKLKGTKDNDNSHKGSYSNGSFNNPVSDAEILNPN